jgi:predicted permease
LSRALARSRDRAVRTALGASRGQLIREALVEYGLLGVAGAALGVAVAEFTVRTIVAYLPEAMTISSLNAIDVDGRALTFLLGTAVLTVLAFGLPSAFMSSRVTVAEALRRESRAATGTSAARRVRSGLAVAEIALSIILLVGAALMTRTMLELQAIDTGLDTRGLLATGVGLPEPQYSDQSTRGIFVESLLDRLRQDPDVISAGAGSLPPLTPMVTVGPIEFSDRPGERTPRFILPVYDVWPGFFAAAGIRVADGRDFLDDDVEGAAIVSEEFARTHWPAGSAVGARFRVGEAAWRTVVGVVADIRGRHRVEEIMEGGQIYFPSDQVGGVFRAVQPASMIAEDRTIVVRARVPDAVAARLPDLIHAVDPQVVVGRTRPVEQQFAEAIARPRVVFLMMAIFAGFGLLLAGAGLYGVLSHLVAQRRREIGIRLALGATPRDVGRSILGSGLALAGAGVMVGLLASLGLVRVMQTLLYDVDSRDPAAFAAVCIVLVGAAALAAWRPARRAMRVDPLALLRDE